MQDPVKLIDHSGDLVSVIPSSLHVRCRRIVCCGEVFVGYNIHASKADTYCDDVVLQTPLLHNAEEALDFIDIMLNHASDVQPEPDTGGALCT